MTTHRPHLNGLRILNTRPTEQAHALSLAIHEAQGVSIELPTLSIQPTLNWIRQLPDLTKIQQALFISKSAIHYFFTGLAHAHISWPKSIPITVLGQGSAKALAAFDLTAQHLPIVADSEHVLSMTHLQVIQNQSILIAKGAGGRPLLENTFKQRGANVYPIVVYTRELPKKNHETIAAVWQNDAVDIILFTSQQAMEQLFVLMGQEAHSWIQHKPCVVISTRLAEAAATLGIKNVIVSRYDELLKTLEQLVLDVVQK